MNRAPDKIVKDNGSPFRESSSSDDFLSSDKEEPVEDIDDVSMPPELYQS